MAKVNKIIKKTVDALKQPFNSEEMQARKTEALQVKGQEFIVFYRDLLKEINNHLEYETDLQRTKSVPDEAIVKFNINKYISKLHTYFSKQHLYKSVNDDAFRENLLQVLLINESDYAEVSKKIFSMLFVGILITISDNSKIPVPTLLKDYYLLIKKNIPESGETDYTAIFEKFREYIAAYGITIDETGNSTYINKVKVFTDLLDIYKINKKKDIEAIFKRSNILFFVLKILGVFLVAGLISYSIKGLDDTVTVLLKFNVTINSIIGGALFLVLCFFIYGFAANRAKKRYLVKTFASLRQNLNLDDELLEMSLNSKYLFDFKTFK